MAADFRILLLLIYPCDLQHVQIRVELVRAEDACHGRFSLVVIPDEEGLILPFLSNHIQLGYLRPTFDLLADYFFFFGYLPVETFDLHGPR